MFRKKGLDRFKLIQTISYLRTMENKVRFIEERVRSNSEKGFKEIVKHYSNGSRELAEALASEVAEQRKLAETIARFRLGIERIRLRLETLLDIGGTAEMLKEIAPMLSDLKKTGIEAVPEFGIMFSELQNKLIDLGFEMDSGLTFPGFSAPNIEASSDEVKKILLEAKEIAKERMASKMPEPP